MKDRTLWAAGLSILALVAHAATPLAIVRPGGTYWAYNWHDALASVDPVGAASMGILWVGLALLVAGAVAVAALTRWAPQATMARLGVAGIALIGAVLSLRAAGMWTGRGIASLIRAPLRMDGPPARHAFGGAPDHFAWVWPISPVLVLGLTVAAVWLLLSGLARTTAPGADRDQAVRHTLAARWSLLAVALLATVPWAIETTEDAHEVAEGATADTDPFPIGLYDAARRYQDTQVFVDATGEAGLSEYDELASVPLYLLLVGLTSSLAALLGLAGVARMQDEDKVLGRGLQNGGAILALAVAGLGAMGTLLVALFFTAPNDMFDGAPAWAPLAGTLLFLVSLPAAVAALRHLSADQDRLIADRFPEPIVYE